MTPPCTNISYRYGAILPSVSTVVLRVVGPKLFFPDPDLGLQDVPDSVLLVTTKF
jgi:hypothetical protein